MTIDDYLIQIYSVLMKILVVSDTHGNYLAPLECMIGAEIEMIIHLGDNISDAKELEQLLAIPVVKVPGNCDHNAPEPREITLNLEGRIFFISHGDHCRVKAGTDLLVQRAKREKADIVLYGHTHRPLVSKVEGMLLVNPGTLMAGSATKSAAIITISCGEVTTEVIYL
jgi:phosphoesterase, MJ0936 family